MVKIPSNEIQIDSSSYVDPYGRVFLWNERVFRGVSLDNVEHVKRLMKNDVVRHLQDKGMLIDSRIPTETAERFDFLIEHQRVSYPSYCMEWPPQMLKDAALLTLNICFEISDENLTLQDAYPWNIFFNGTKPVFIDFGSLVPARDDVLWAPYEQFCNFFLFPLYLYSAGCYDVARRFLFDYLGGLQAQQFFQLAPFSLKARHPLRYAKHASNYYSANIIRRLGLEEKTREFIKKLYQNKKINVGRGRKKFLESLLKEVESISMTNKHSYWRSYYENKEGMCSYKKDDFTQKENIVRDVLHKYKPLSVFDAGCNTGMYSFLAAENGVRVIAVDTDESSVSKLYQDAKRRGADILPLVMDVLNPSPKFGWLARQFPSAMERFQADMVFAFALIHHLAITGRQGFERALEALNAFTKKYVLVEFIDKDDPKVIQLMAHSLHSYPWYSFEKFKSILERRSRNITYFEPHSLTRRFVLYEKQ